MGSADYIYVTTGLRYAPLFLPCWFRMGRGRGRSRGRSLRSCPCERDIVCSLDKTREGKGANPGLGSGSRTGVA